MPHLALHFPFYNPLPTPPSPQMGSNAVSIDSSIDPWFDLLPSHSYSGPTATAGLLSLLKGQTSPPLSRLNATADPGLEEIYLTDNIKGLKIVTREDRLISWRKRPSLDPEKQAGARLIAVFDWPQRTVIY